MQISRLLLHFTIEHLFSFTVLGNKDVDIFLFHLYVTLAVFSGKILSILCWLCNTGKYFSIMILILESNGLYCVTKLHEAKNVLLFSGLLSCSLEMFLTSENCFLTLLGL